MHIPLAHRLADMEYHVHKIQIVFDLPTRHSDCGADAMADRRQHRADCIDVCGHVAYRDAQFSVFRCAMTTAKI